MSGVVDPGRCGCKFPLWGEERYQPGVSLFCGEARIEGSPYCREHFKLCRSEGTPSDRTAPNVLKHLSAQGL